MANPKVIIVGGGLAGLTAAKTLCESGKFEVTLLEANKAVGGRVRNGILGESEVTRGTSIPLGAASFHGRTGNSLYTYAKSEGLLKSKEYNVEDDCVLHTYSQGRSIPEDVIEIVEDKVEEILDGLEVCHRDKDWSLFKTMKPILSKDKPNGLTVLPVDLHDLIVAEMEPILLDKQLASHDSAAVLEGVLACEGITEGSKGLRGINPVSLGAWLYLDDDTDVIFEDNPFLKIVDNLASKIPPGVININKEVTKVMWNCRSSTEQDSSIRVECTDSTSYQGDHVIYTCSLGVLKYATATGMFVPELPTDKVTAINELDIGLVNKVFLQFNTPLLPNTSYTQFRLYWTEEDMHQPLISSNKWATGIQIIETFPYKRQDSDPYVYYTFLTGEDAAAIETLPESTLSNVISHALRLFLGQSVPKILSMKVTKWSNDYTRGSYSFTPQRTSYDRRADLAHPVDSKDGYPLQILFAGEATSLDQFGCAHAAYDTGLREAKRLMDYYTRDSSCNAL